jgi:Caspase domain
MESLSNVMTVTRRNFLQGVGRWGAGLWMADLALVDRYKSVLAQPTARKLALLVGIDRYPTLSHMPFLKGSATDVELQRELLISRFGFSRQDILTLVDEDATRSNIETAFIAHLCDRARPGDVVVFHFSGYGCLIRTQAQPENGGQPYGDRQGFVTYDAGFPDLAVGGLSTLNALYEDTLFLLLRSLPTDRVTTLLDCGFMPTGTLRSTSLRERSLSPWDVKTQLEAELALQDRLLAQTQLTRDQVQVQRQSGQLPGLVLAAATAKYPMAIEQDLDGFSAGVFSRCLTQQLWANTPATNITIAFGQLSTQIAQGIGPGTQPTAKGQKSTEMLPLSAGSTSMPAVGIVSLVDRRGKTGKLWLGGLPDMLLELERGQSCFRAINPYPPGADASVPPVNLVLLPDIPSPTLVQIRSRQGWTAIAQHLSGPLLQEGWLLEEAIRVLPRAISLRLALGADLSRIERVDATSVVSMKKNSLRVVRREQPADYIFTKLAQPPADPITSSRPSPLTLALSNPPPVRYGLAYLGGALISNTVGDRGEVVKRAIERLQPTLDTLLAIKLLDLSLNYAGSALRISASLEQVETPPQILIRLQSMGVVLPQATPETPEPVLPKADKTSSVLSIPSGTPIQYRITNGEPFPIYVLLVGFNGGTSTFVSYTLEGDPPQDGKPLLKTLVVAPGSSAILPVAAQAWKASSFAGLNKTFIIGTRQPLAQTLVAQINGMKSMLPSVASGFAPLLNPLAIAQSLLADLHQASLPTTSSLEITGSDIWALDVREWASLQFIYTTI